MVLAALPTLATSSPFTVRSAGLAWRRLVTGHGNEWMNGRGRFDTRWPHAEPKAHGHAKTCVRATDNAVDFSRLIRQGVPGIGEQP